jgi:ABC-type sugar transport system ATPase subunit
MQPVPVTERQPRLVLRGITKRYPAVVANDNVDLEVRPAKFTPCWVNAPGRAR